MDGINKKLNKTLANITSQLQHSKKNKNDGWRTIRTKAAWAEYIKKIGNGSVNKGLYQLFLAYETLKHTHTDPSEDPKLRVIAEFTQEYLENISLVDHDLAINHFSNLPALIYKYKVYNKWDPNLLKKKTVEDELDGKKQ